MKNPPIIKLMTVYLAITANIGDILDRLAFGGFVKRNADDVAIVGQVAGQIDVNWQACKSRDFATLITSADTAKEHETKHNAQ